MRKVAFLLLLFFSVDIYTRTSDTIVSDTLSQETDEWTDLRKQALRDPFADTDEFAINFANYTVEEWSYPLPGGKVISPFGGRRKHHAGTDIKTVRNDTLRAAFSGLVTLSGPHYGYGYCVVLRHANGIETLYSHNSKNLVKVGQWVDAGAAVALEGSTGRATTHHLHFETRVAGRAFNSDQIFDHENHTLRKFVVVFAKKKGGALQISSRDRLPSEIPPVDSVKTVAPVPLLPIRTPGILQNK